jgi:hypothetical protein
MCMWIVVPCCACCLVKQVKDLCVGVYSYYLDMLGLFPKEFSEVCLWVV